MTKYSLKLIICDEDGGNILTWEAPRSPREGQMTAHADRVDFAILVDVLRFISKQTDCWENKWWSPSLNVYSEDAEFFERIVLSLKEGGRLSAM